MPRRGEITVVVPLQIGDRQRIQQRADLPEQVVHHLVPREIQDKLIARRRPRAALQMQTPVGMGPIEVAVRIDHLRLDPQAKPHALADHVLSQRRKTFRVLGEVRRPVPQPRPVVMSAMEPAVVQHEPLHPRLGGEICEGLEVLKLVVEIDRFPGIEVHRPRRHRAPRPGHPLANGGVHRLRCPIETGA